jgi:hypothetical protein
MIKCEVCKLEYKESESIDGDCPGCAYDDLHYSNEY